MAANLIVMSDDDDEIEDDLWEIAANYVNNFRANVVFKESRK